MAKKPTGANANISLYDGQWQATFDCPGRCRHSSFYVDPPEEEDQCSSRSPGGDCSWPPAHRDALLAIRDRLGDELEKLNVEDRT